MKKQEIKVEKLSHIFQEYDGYSLSALKDVTLTFHHGQITAIIGASASGKTVLLKHLNGLLLPTTGEVAIKEYRITAGQKKIPYINKIRKNIGFVFQFAQKQLFEETVEKDIIFGPLNFGIDKKNAKQKAKKYLDLFGLDEQYLKRSPFELSGGQKRRVAIAGIFAYEPEFIIFDQLASGFDAKIKEEFLALLLKLKHQMNKTIIFTSNNNNDVLKIANRVIVLSSGQVINDTTPLKLFSDTAFCQKFGIQIPKTIKFINL